MTKICSLTFTPNAVRFTSVPFRHAPESAVNNVNYHHMNYVTLLSLNI